MSDLLALRLFGPPHITWQAETVTGFVSNKARALLIFLATTHCAHSRDTLAELLWSDTPDTAKSNLRRALSNLRALNGITFREDSSQLVALNLDHCWVDIIEFEQLAHTFGAGDDLDDIQDDAIQDTDNLDGLAHAAQLYHDDFLTGFNTSLSYEFEVWALREQTRLKVEVVDVLRRLADGYIQRHNLPQAIAAVRRLLYLEPWREEAHRKLIECLALDSDISGALVHFETCRQALRAELDVEPSAETLELVAKIRAGLFPGNKPFNSGPSQRIVHTGVYKQVATRVEFPLIGRDHEWHLVRTLWQEVNHPHFVCIGGEAGIGKTRLAEELLLLAEQEGALVARTRSHALQGQLAYGPITDWLRAAPLQAVLAELADVWLSEITRLLPELLIERPALPPPQPLQEGWQRKRFFDALVHAFTGAFATADNRLLLVLDDLQWTDGDTLEWLQYLLERSNGRLLVVGTVRTDEINREHPWQRVRQQLQQHDKLTDLQLASLNSAATAELAVQVRGQEVASDLIERLIHEMSGNPLFVIESLRVMPSATHTAVLSSLPPDKADQDKADEESDPISMPPKMYNVIQARLAQLSPEAQSLAQLGATIGRAFDVQLLAQAANRDEEAVLLGLDELWQRRIVREVDTVRFDFSHDRIRDVAYAEISPVKRRLLHRNVANALEMIHHENLANVYGELATHYEHSGFMEKAVAFSLQAATQALQLSAHQEAIAYLLNGLTLLKTLPLNHHTLRQELAFKTTLAVPIAATRGFASSEVRAIYQDAQALTKRLREPPSIPVLRGLASTLIVGAELEDACTVVPELLQLAQQTQESAQLAEAHYAMSTLMFWMGRLEDARDHFQHAIYYYGLVSDSNHTSHYANHPGIVCLSMLSITLWCLGYPQRALQCAAASLVLAQKVDHALSYACALSFNSRLQYCLSNPPNALDFAGKTIQVAAEHKFPFWAAVSMTFQGWALAELGKPKEGLAKILEGIQAYGRKDAVVGLPWFLGLAVSIHKQLGEIDVALATVEHGLEVAHRTKDCVFEPELWRLKGELLIMQTAQEQEAEAAFSRAIAVARSQQAKSWQLRATMSLSRLWQKQGKAVDAYEELVDIYGWFTEGFDTNDLVEAKALLGELYEAKEQTVHIRRIVS